MRRWPRTWTQLGSPSTATLCPSASPRCACIGRGGPWGQTGPAQDRASPLFGGTRLSPCLAGWGIPEHVPGRGRGLLPAQLGSPLWWLHRAWVPQPARCWLDAGSLLLRPGVCGSCWAGGCGRQACWQPLPALDWSMQRRRCAETMTTPDALLKVSWGPSARREVQAPTA